MEQKNENEKRKKVCLVNLGCKVNQYEIDGIVGTLEGDFDIATTLQKADIYVLNTCAVTQEAERKSRQFVAKIVKLNKNAKIYVCGCASEHNAQQFLAYPQVECVLGTANKGKMRQFFGKTGNCTSLIPKQYEDDLTATNVRTRGYVKIQDGCNNFCSYCLIPYVRGRSRSRSLDSIVAEAKLLSNSCHEIVITGINVSDYKIDGRLALADVILALKDLPCRVRLSSLEVNVITREFLDKIRTATNFCPHFHLSLQSGSDKVLKDMNRHYTTSEYFEKVLLIREVFPHASITTDIIVGYPTETEKDFQDTVDFVQKVGFFSVHFFAYSSREGTRASRLPIINGTVIKQREKILKKVANACKQKFLQKFIGQPLEVLFECQADGFYSGFSREYIRAYISSNEDISSKMMTVRAVKIFGDGVECEKID